MTLPPNYPSPSPPMVTRGMELPQWAKGFRATLMVFHTLGMVGVIVYLLAVLIPTEPGMGGTAQKSWTLLFLWFSFIITVIPYVVANIVYGILWLTSIRGKGYRATTFVTVFLTAAPLIVTAVVLSGIAQAFAQ
ncbi:hypothetical protein [Arthrobacter sp. UYCo732]|uniref:hypothetical protein n=1 Tax=Arthrobacter sp. UYCo732 TaxID=3156336 RepID=UPI0033981CF0